MRRPKRNKNLLMREIARMEYERNFYMVKCEKVFNAVFALQNIRELEWPYFGSAKEKIFDLDNKIKAAKKDLHIRHTFRNSKDILTLGTVNDMIRNKSNAELKNCRYFTGQGFEILVDFHMIEPRLEHKREEIILPETFIDIFKMRLGKYQLTSEWVKRKAGHGKHSYAKFVHHSNFGILSKTESGIQEQQTKFINNIKDTAFIKFLSTGKIYALKLSEIYVKVDSNRVNKSAYRALINEGKVNNRYKQKLIQRGDNESRSELIKKALLDSRTSLYKTDFYL